jgi:ATP-dependent DNA helicase RecG
LTRPKIKNDPVKAGNDLVKRAILSHLLKYPEATYTELAEKTGYGVSTIKRHIQELKKQGLINRLGSDKKGQWKINE